MDAHVWMTGRVGSDVDYKVINNTFAVASFRMACTPRTQRNGEWTDEPTTWVSVRCARSLAEGAKCSLIKGDPIAVIGRLRTHTWTDSEGGLHEQLRIEAITLGHDLTQGTSAFRRLRRSNENGPGGEVDAGNEAVAAECHAADDGPDDVTRDGDADE